MKERHISRLGIAGAVMISLGTVITGDGLIAEKNNENIVNQTYPKLPQDTVDQAKKVQSVVEKKAGRLIRQDAASDPNQETWHKNWEEFRLWESSPNINAWLKIASQEDARKEKLDELNNRRGIDAELALGVFSFITGMIMFSYRL